MRWALPHYEVELIPSSANKALLLVSLHTLACFYSQIKPLLLLLLFLLRGSNRKKALLLRRPSGRAGSTSTPQVKLPIQSFAWG